MHCFSKRSLANLEGVHPDLVKVCQRAIELTNLPENCDIDFIITDGSRTIEEQRQFVAEGKSQTMKSRHLGGLAIDFVALCAGRVTYDWDPMKRLSDIFKQAGSDVGVGVEWGGDWKHFKDTPHIQLSKEAYPDVAA